MLMTAKVEGIVEAMDEAALVERLPELPSERLFEISAAVLFRNLPNVQAESLVGEVPPTLAPESAPPLEIQASPTLGDYIVPRSVADGWVTLVDGPAPIESVRGKFSRQLSDVHVTVEIIEEPPAGSPDFAPGQIVNALFRINIDRARPEDISVVHVAFFVEKSWLEANQVHKWSIRFNRFDEKRGVWVAFPSKRVSEDGARVFYRVVLPGFSDMAITGSVELPRPVFQVTGLEIEPASPDADSEVTVSAQVANTGTARSVYPAHLWINDTIEATQAVDVEPGQAVPFRFTVRKPEGSYRVRVERLLGEFSVSAAAGPLPTPAAAAPGQEAAAAPTEAPVAAPAAAPPSPADQGEGGGLVLVIVGAAAAIGVVAVVVFFLVRRRGPTTPASASGPQRVQM